MFINVFISHFRTTALQGTTASFPLSIYLESICSGWHNLLLNLMTNDLVNKISRT